MNLKTFLNVLISVFVVLIVFNLFIPFSSKRNEGFAYDQHPNQPMVSPETVKSE